jgi:hypothetical protein
VETRKKDHYLPAALIGGFGMPNPPETRRRRGWWVGTRPKTPSDAPPSRVQAQDIAYAYGLYAVENPTPDLPEDYAEEIWRTYESQLPDAAKAMETDDFADRDWQVILKHIQAVWIRNPGFDDDVRRSLAAEGTAEPTSDDIERLRRDAYRALEPMLASARFAIVRRGAGVPQVPRFIIDNRGFVPLHDVANNHSGVLFPLTGNVAVLMAYGVAQPGDDHDSSRPLPVLTLSAGGAEAFHAATWNHEGIEFVVCHPDDIESITRLSDATDAQLPRSGPYRGNAGTVFEWALRQVALQAEHEPR